MSNFYAVIGQDFTVSSCEKFAQRLETCLLIAKADRVLCHLACNVLNSCFQDCFIIHGWFFYWLVKVIGNPISEASRSQAT